MVKRTYKGAALDITWQDFADRPYGGEGETVSVTDREDESRIQTEGVDEAIKKLQQDSKFIEVDDWISNMRKWDFDWRQELAMDDGLPILIKTCIFSSIYADMNEYNAQVDIEKWGEYAGELEIPYRKLMGLFPASDRQYIGDSAMHNQYKEYVTDILPKQAPDPLNNPVR